MNQLPSFENTQPVEIASAQTPQELPKFEDTHPVDLPKFEDTEEVKAPDESVGRQIGTFVEGAAQGIAGPLATAAELGLGKLGVPGLSAEEINQRAKDFPTTSTAGQVVGFGAGLLTGASEARAAQAVGAGALKLLPEATGVMAKIGQSALNNAIQAGFIQGSNEVSKALLGQGDPEGAASSWLGRMGYASLFGGAVGAGAGAIGATANKLLTDVPPKVEKFLIGLGASSKMTPEEIASYPTTDPWVRKGMEFFPRLMKHLENRAVGAITGYAAGSIGEDKWYKQVGGALLGAIVEPHIAKAVATHAPGLIYKLIGNAAETGAMEKSLTYAVNALKGENQLAKGVQTLFDYGSSKAAVEFTDPTKDMEKIHSYLEEGGVDKDIENMNQSGTQGFARGGQVSPTDNGLTQFPEQNMLLSAAKARVSNYLNMSRPGNAPKLPFDSNRANPEKEKTYKKKLMLAARPLSILNDIKKGTLTPDRVNDIKNMYPEVYRGISKKLTEQIVKQTSKGGRPPQALRQSLSLFLGSNLDSTMTPQSIMAAQATFAQKQAPQMVKTSKASLSKMGSSQMTAEQSRTARLNKG